MKLPKFLAGIIGGTTLGLLFAQKSGKNFRKSLSKNKDKIPEILGKELLSVGKEISEEVKKIVETEDVQDLINGAKDKFKGLTDIAKAEGGDFAVDVEKYLTGVSKYAKEKAVELDKFLKPKTKSTVKKAKKAVSKKAKSVKKTVVKKTATAKKAVAKKTKTIKKSVAKTAKKAGKTVKSILM